MTVSPFDKLLSLSALNKLDFVTFLAENLDAVAESCRKIGAKIIVEPKVFNRPFHEGKRDMIVRSFGGEYLEIIEK